MAVDVQGDRHRGVSESPADHGDGHAAGQRDRRVGVPKIVQPDLRQSGCFHEFGERGGHIVRGLQLAAVQPCEHGLGVVPGDVRCQPFLDLPPSMPLELGDRRGVERDLSSAMGGLGLVDDDPALRHRPVAVDEDGPGLQIDVVPSQPERLAPPQPRRGVHQPERVQAILRNPLHDGAAVAFRSNADNLVDGDTNKAQDIFLHHRVANDGDTRTTTYAYDAANRLVEACFDDTCDDQLAHTYDGVGNRLTEQTPDGTTTYSYDAADRLTATDGPDGTVAYDHDANGNRIQAGDRTFAYDLANRLAATSHDGVEVGYSYDGDGIRTSRTVDGQTDTTWTWDVNAPLPVLTNESDADGTTERSYQYGNDLISQTNPDGSASYFHHDRIGSVTHVTGDDGAPRWAFEYEPFGTLRDQTQLADNAPQVDMRYTGELHDDETGLYHLRARQYDPTTGSFLTTDPLAPAITDPYVSAYVYVNNQPTVSVDPSGMVQDANQHNGPWYNPNLNLDYGTVGASAFNTLYGSFKIVKGVPAVLGGGLISITVPIKGQVVGAWAVMYGGYQIVSGTARVRRGVDQWQGGPAPCQVDCSLIGNVKRFGVGIAPKLRPRSIWDVLAGLP